MHHRLTPFNISFAFYFTIITVAKVKLMAAFKTGSKVIQLFQPDIYIPYKEYE